MSKHERKTSTAGSSGQPLNGIADLLIHGGKFMRSMKFLAAFVAVAFCLSLSALARDTNSGKFNLQQTAKVGTTVLQPGQYKAEWTGNGNDLNISIIKDGKTVATTRGTLKQLQSKAPYSAVTLKTLPDNSASVDEIDFNNRTDALVLGGM